MFFAPPYFQHFASSSIADLEIAHEWLLNYVKDHGPYDGVMSFSQGCSLSASFLLFNHARNPLTPPPFKVAIFICGGLPLDCLPVIGIDVPEEARDLNVRSAYLLAAQASTEAIIRSGVRRWATGYEESSTPEKKDVFGFDFEKIPKEKLIPIPTAHIYGSKDPRFPASVTLAHFCVEDTREVFNHGGGHEIPRRTEVSQKIAEILERCKVIVES